VRLYLRDLSRRRLVWILALLLLGGAALNYWASRSIDQAIGEGATWAMATRGTASGLDDLASTFRSWSAFAVMILAAQVAPESRRNGTTQFILSCGIGRDMLAAAQFAALALLIASATLVVHIAFSIAGLKAGAMSSGDAAMAWPLLLLPMIGVAAAVLGVSLTMSAIETYFLFLGVPLLTRILPTLMHGLPQGLPMWIVRAIDNVALFFPDATAVVFWPHATSGKTLARSALAMSAVHGAMATAFWIVLGLYRHRRHDFGSRTAGK
jgi:hypothetical protein